MSTENTTTATCRRCERPVADAAPACAACVAQTRDNLAWIADHAHELDTTLTRQDRVTAPSIGHTTETPLPVNLHASDVANRLRGTLTTWARIVMDERGTSHAEAFPTPAPMNGPVCWAANTWCAHASCRAVILETAPEITNAGLARYLHDRTGWMAHAEWSPEAFDDIGRCAVDLARAIDTPPPIISLGTCDIDDCDGELRAHQEAPWTRCPICDTPYDVARRRDALLARASHVRRGATDLARILTALGDRDADGRLIVRKPKWVENRVQRKQLHAVGRDERGRPLYRLGDARRLHDAEIAKDLQKAAARAEHAQAA